MAASLFLFKTVPLHIHMFFKNDRFLQICAVTDPEQHLGLKCFGEHFPQDERRLSFSPMV